MIRPPRNLAGRPSKTMEILQQRMQEIQTRAEFEALIELDTPADRRVAMRRLLEPMLRPHLPCCGKAMQARVHDQPIAHAPHCPEMNRVTLH